MSCGTAPGRCARGLALLCLVLAVAPATAQIPPPVRDTIRRPARDTLPPDTTQQDSIPPAVRFPAMPVSGATNPAEGVWLWDHAALLRETPVSLVDLLRRIPGVATFRSGIFVQPEAAASFGATAGRIEIELDGFRLDPLIGAASDLSRIPIAHLREVRVERRLGVLRILLQTEQPEAGQPYSRVEAGIGQPDANFFRGVFLAPHVIFGPLSVGVDRLDTDGYPRREPANIFTGWAKWAWTGERRGLQVELFRTTLNRDPDVPWAITGVQQDIIARGRMLLAPGLVGEGYVGREWFEDDLGETANGLELVDDRVVVQAGARLAYGAPFGTLAGAFRFRSHAELPQTEAQLDARVGFGPAAASASLTRFSWQSGTSATTYDLHGSLGPPFLTAFAQLTGGSRGAPKYAPGINVPLLTERDGWRIGAAVKLGQRASGSFAFVNLEQDIIRPFGLPFDSLGLPSTAEPARGYEAFGRVVLLPGWFALEGWLTNWTKVTGWTYLPVRTWRTALELHAVPLPSRNLEILGRLEGVYRGGMLAYAEPTVERFEQPQTALPGYTLFHGYLQIRIIDVRIFINYEDLLGNDVEELPGRVQRGPRFIYGVRWNLWN